ncbi:FAD-binding oxidoreductase [Cupriavidus gilardii]|uniref:NAD(P)/FAD-dependent oxidoreductase n=1 Tax=Cupriavidus gilardii TaxID=82541 RepID=UPI001573475D|nr:FAD-dependent oxidoreductase [Cupriavidus gilardii]MCG5262786.1 FAD-binding oxidoreductase [Cupriavidus gilardii]MDF9432225.1 FAD-binding oxidoreductase [Cupriavidus gilardii]NSX05477.1 FAD-binding oxidoreductase [Cupriavidus gilardii]
MPAASTSRYPLFDVAVVGGGLVGSALAYGLRQHAGSVAVLDEGDVALRASRGNFGLVWLQSKGYGMGAYSRWTLKSTRLWPTLAADLLQETGIDVALEQKGGLTPLMGDYEIEARLAWVNTLMSQPDVEPYEWKLLDHHQAAALVPGLGPDVTGAIWTPHDGIVNPLKLLRAFHTAFSTSGVQYLPHHGVTDIVQQAGGQFVLTTTNGVVRARKVVLAGGLRNGDLGRMVGIDLPMAPQRGQILVLERTRRLLDTPMVTLRQNDEGSWLVGDSQEDAGYNDQVTTLPVLATLADRAVRTLPALRDVRAVRAWSALRVRAKDGFPVYEQSSTHPGAFVVTCHSGVTLAATHALNLAPMIAAGQLPPELATFSTRRFHVPKN